MRTALLRSLVCNMVLGTDKKRNVMTIIKIARSVVGNHILHEDHRQSRALCTKLDLNTDMKERCP